MRYFEHTCRDPVAILSRSCRGAKTPCRDPVAILSRSCRDPFMLRLCCRICTLLRSFVHIIKFQRLCLHFNTYIEDNIKHMCFYMVLLNFTEYYYLNEFHIISYNFIQIQWFPIVS